MAVHRIFNFENHSSTTFVNDSTVSTSQVPLSAIDLMGSKLMDTDTGEIFAEKPNWFYPIERVGDAFFKEEVGEPMLKELTRPSDLKARVFALTGMQPNEIFNNSQEITDEEIYTGMLEDGNDDEANAFNDAMERSPYSCDKNGVSMLEKHIAKNAEDVKNVQEFIGQMSHPFFQELSKLPEEQRNAILEQVQQTLNNQNATPPPTHTEE